MMKWLWLKIVVSVCLLPVLLAWAGEFTVTNSNDSGAGSLRWAIEQTNSTEGPHKISFNIPLEDSSYDASLGVWVLKPHTTLPKLTRGSVTIDGTTQTTNVGDTNPKGPEIMLDGSLIEGIAKGFEVVSSHNWIHGLAIGNFSQNQVAFIGEEAHHNKITGCYVGITPDGKGALTSIPGWNGIMITAGADFNIVGGTTEEERNVVGGMKFHGIVVYGNDCRENVIIGNRVGTDPTGSYAIPNKRDGIRLEQGAVHNRVGGTALEERNLCSGNLRSGIRIEGVGADSNLVMGNWVGLASDGMTALPNGDGGIVIMKGASFNIIGGQEDGAANVVSGNRFTGVQIRGASRYNQVLGNVIGLAADGQTRLGNEHNGVMLSYGASFNKIGPDNIICANGFASGDWASGVVVAGVETSDNEIVGNYIGVLKDETPVGNVNHGVCIQDGAHRTKVGPDNVIASNGGDGVRMLKDQTLYNTITENSIYANGGKGIEAKDGANKEISPPVLQLAEGGIISGVAEKNVRVEIYMGPDTEGKSLVGVAYADEEGRFSIEAGELEKFVTATLTDSAGNTSEFSASIKTGVEQFADGRRPDTYVLEQNYPNPFNPSTIIAFAIPSLEHVTLDVFNLQGQRIARLIDRQLPAGKHQVEWNVSGSREGTLSSGVYFYRLTAGRFTRTKKMTVLK